MSKPAAYSNTDAAEIDALAVLMKKLNSKREKADIKTRDKYPNVDGTIELVQPDQVPFGKFDVQLKKIPHKSSRYDCPASLYEYSRACTLPVLLLLVDVESNAVYWKHIHHRMMEFIDGQKTFTINLGPDDVIDDSGAYFRKWATIVDDYKQRIARFPDLLREHEAKVELAGISDSDVQWFQEYSDELNHTLNRDLVCIKRKFLSTMCRIGIGIESADDNMISYRHYILEDGSRHPLVFTVKEEPFGRITDQRVVSQCWTRRDNLGNPKRKALEYLKPKVETALRDHLLDIHGEILSSDIIQYFITRFPHALGLNSGSTHSVADVRHSIEHRLFMACHHAYPVNNQDESLLVADVDLERLEYVLSKNPLTSEARLPPNGVVYRLQSYGLALGLLADSVRFMTISQINSITPVWKDAGDRVGGYIWSFANKDITRTNLRILFQKIIHCYVEFCKGNALCFPRSPYLDPSISVIFEISMPSDNTPHPGPRLTTILVKNNDFILPKVIVTFSDDDPPALTYKPLCREISVRGDYYDALSVSQSILSWPFRDCPYLRGIYSLLERDLNLHYGFAIHTTIA